MSEWKEYKLGEVAKFSYGRMPKKALLNNGQFPTFSGYKYQYTYPEYNCEKGDLIIVARGVGGTGDVKIIREKCYLTNLSIKVDFKKRTIFNDFFYYFFKQETLRYLDSGSAQSQITIQDLERESFILPDFETQKSIASILSSLDDKIDLLHRQSATLEKMAETLFRQWFVEEAEEDWEEISLFDAIELIGGGTPKTTVNEYWNGNIKWLSGGDIAGNHKSFVVSSEKSITELGLKNSSAKLLPKFSTIISARGTVGKYCILSEPMTFSQSNYGVLPKFKDCFFFTYLLVAHSVDELQSAAYGSVFDTITTNTFKGLTITLPEEEYIIRFNESMEPFFSKILTNQTQIRTLSALRDTLLPKLMSGEVKIEQ